MRFVLAHRAGHGAWCWDRLIPELQKLGHDAVAIDLPGHGERASEESTIPAYRDAVLEALKSGDVLVGHSMGSAVVAVAADARPDLVGHLCLIAGPLPVEGKPLSYRSTSPSDCFAEVGRATPVGGSVVAEEEEESAARRGLTMAPEGRSFWWDREGAKAAFYHDLDEATIDWAASKLMPQALAPVTEPLHLPNLTAADLPRSYVVCLQDRTCPPRVSRLQASRFGVEPLTIDSSHSPFLSRPAILAELLVRGVDTPPICRMTLAEDAQAAPANAG